MRNKSSSIVEEFQRAVELLHAKVIVGNLIELEDDECLKEEENDLEKKENKRNVQRRRENAKEELVALENSKEINFYAYQTNSSLVKASKNQEGRLFYNPIKTISFFPSKSYLCFEIFFKEIKLFSLDFENNIVVGLKELKFLLETMFDCPHPSKEDHFQILIPIHKRQDLENFLNIKWNFEKIFDTSRDFGNFASMFPYFDCEVMEFVESERFESQTF
ncbi:hypothetical protein M9H77_12341 [Catharanthus roseus]|uniref:Uncharacterized protein n=1 Tax=Catharanthus roseus TaxID=4058 RepID=A0ACC0BH46_CATRO|nr:hypothetical protein M9H77_12341 [Catharanthus roseus]